MPDMNGFDVAAVLKNDPQTMGIPIIILSIVEDQARGFGLGVDAYLTKPINAELLLRNVKMLVAQGASRRKVLVVNQDELTVKTLVDVLQAKGFTVVQAANEQDFLEKALATQPDTVIANTQFWEQSAAVQSLRLEKGLEHIFLILVVDPSVQDLASEQSG